ncbi:MAG: glycosyltransferase [Proteobacteria bacterium]|nr:glycosyltransferase [Pseudomonadota bacterium]
MSIRRLGASGVSTGEMRRGRAADPVLTRAIRGLWLADPDLSARGAGPKWLIPVLVLLLFGLAFGMVLDPARTITSTGLILTLPFGGSTLLRLVAALEAMFRPIAEPRRCTFGSRPGERLPTYTVFVPLYDEASVLPALVAGLVRLDYPPELLDIVIVLEERDPKTQAAAALMTFPRHMRTLVVPSGGPKTKPKALDYALAFATSELIVVFDAEDRPEPDQLRIAARTFAESGPELACAQARLNVYNSGEGFLARGLMAQKPLELNP